MDSLKGKHAWTVKVGEKGQFVIPKEARKIFNINPGDTLIVLADDERGIAIPPKGFLVDITGKMFGTEIEKDIKKGDEE